METKHACTRRQRRNVKRWIEDLRDGGRVQTSGTLRNHQKGGVKGYCCLGVLYDEHNDWSSGKGRRRGVLSVSHFEDLTGLSASLQPELAKLNDSGRSFKQIATIIARKMSHLDPHWKEGL